MENMQKRDSKADLNKNSIPDEFGKDFFDSWKSAKAGNATMDFGIEAIPKNKMASFKFDELDSFELSGNFGKLPSFNLAMPDLDFSEPSKKNEKSKASYKESVTGSEGTKVLKEGKFSFDFDFNSFDLDSKSSEDKRPSNNSGKKAQEHSSMQDKIQESSDNNSTSTNLAKGQPSNFVDTTEVSMGKRAAIPEDKEKKTCVTIDRRERSSKNYLAKVSLPELQTDSASSDVMGQRATTEKHDSMHPIGISPSSSSSPVDSFNSDCWTKTTAKELPNSGSELQKLERQQPLNCINGGLTGSNEIRKDAYNSNIQNKSIDGVKSIDEKQSSYQNLIQSQKKLNTHQNIMLPSLKSDIVAARSTKLGLMNSGMQLKTFCNLGDNIPQQLPAFVTMPFNSTMEMRTKAAHASTITESSLQFKSSSASCQISMGDKSMEDPSIQRTITKTSVDLKVANAGNSNGFVKENALDKLVCSNKFSSQILKSSKGITSGDNNQHGILHSASVKKMEVIQKVPTSAKPRDAKLVHFLENRMESPLNAASKPTNLAIKENKSSQQSSFKRKLDERSITDLETSSPLKCAKESSTCKSILFDDSPNIKRGLPPEIKIMKTCKDAIIVANQASSTVVPEMENRIAEVSSFALQDDRLRMAEFLTKKIDNVCNMMIKKHEEAKELQVRSIINNNELLLLNFHILEEKNQMLQKFASDLLLMDI